MKNLTSHMPMCTHVHTHARTLHHTPSHTCLYSHIPILSLPPAHIHPEHSDFHTHSFSHIHSDLHAPVSHTYPSLRHTHTLTLTHLCSHQNHRLPSLRTGDLVSGKWLMFRRGTSFPTNKSSPSGALGQAFHAQPLIHSSEQT